MFQTHHHLHWVSSQPKIKAYQVIGTAPPEGPFQNDSKIRAFHLPTSIFSETHNPSICLQKPSDQVTQWCYKLQGNDIWISPAFGTMATQYRLTHRFGKPKKTQVTCRVVGFLVSERKNCQTSSLFVYCYFPRRSMGQVYLPTFTIKINQM